MKTKQVLLPVSSPIYIAQKTGRSSGFDPLPGCVRRSVKATPTSSFSSTSDSVHPKISPINTGDIACSMKSTEAWGPIPPSNWSMRKRPTLGRQCVAEHSSADSQGNKISIGGTLLLNLHSMNSTMTVSYAPGDSERPMVRIANRWLAESGFLVGSKFNVEYANNLITLKKLTHEHSNNLQTPRQVALSTGEAEENI